MSDNENKRKERGPSRYPLGNREQSKRTLARLIRDVLNKRIDIEIFRAAVYGINTLIQIFKIETSVQIQQSILPETLNTLNMAFTMSPEQRRNRIEELLKKSETKDQSPDPVAEILPPPRLIEMPFQPESAEATAQSEDTGAVWQSAVSG